MKYLLFVLLLVCLFAVPLSGNAAVNGYLTGHSHWDDPNGNYDLKICYTPLAKSSAATSEIFHIPFREKDAPNFMDLQVFTNGMQMKVRVNNVAHSAHQTFSTPHTFAMGEEIMFDLVSQGTTFTVYQLNPDRSLGPEWYQWTDSTYTLGVNISYYTVAGYDGRWDFVTARPLDSHGVGHDIKDLEQDARNVPGSGATFDSTIPADGGVTGASLAKSGSQPNWGLASGANYTYTFTVDKPGSGHFDFRAPSSNPDGTGTFFDSSFYRLSLGTTPQIQRFNGSSSGAVFKAPSGSGVAGIYRLNLAGPVMTLTSPSGSTLITVNDGGPQSGVRVRLVPGDQVWSWTGVVGSSTGGVTPPPPPPPPSSGSVTLVPSADAYVKSTLATNDGLSTALFVDADGVSKSLVRFNLSSVTGTVTAAALRVHASSSQSVGYDVFSEGSGWTETGVTYSTAPPFAAKLGSSGAVTGGTWTTVKLPASVVQAAVGGELDIGLSTSSTTNLHLDSRESANPPQLVLTSS